jgi:hypothetical protein
LIPANEGYPEALILDPPAAVARGVAMETRLAARGSRLEAVAAGLISGLLVVDVGLRLALPRGAMKPIARAHR